ncbi:MAG TPA: lipopolysaccharide biosynthesis protein, partial [Enterovirga sp.]
ESQKQVVSQANEQEVQLRALEREARTQREQLESYLTRFREATARDSGNAVPPDARIVSRAVAPQIPSFPKKGPTVALATFAALLLSLGTIVTRELLGSGTNTGPLGPYRPAGRRRDTSMTGEDASGRQGLFGPPAPGAAAASGLQLPALPDPRYDFGHLVERLGRSKVEGRGRHILVTGIGEPGEARDVARGLALTLSIDSRTMLVEIEADNAGTPDGMPGLTDLVAGEASFGEVIHRHGRSRLDVVPSGTLLNEALTVMAEATELTVDAFGQAYEWVIWALSPEAGPDLLTTLAPRSDAAVIASNLEPASQALVRAFETVQGAGAKDVIVAREHALPETAAEAA